MRKNGIELDYITNDTRLKSEIKANPRPKPTQTESAQPIKEEKK